MMRARLLAACAIVAAGCGGSPKMASRPKSEVPPSPYVDGRPTTSLRLQARDAGVVLRHGGCPGDCDGTGARDVWVFEDQGSYYMHYDAAGPKGWLAALAVSKDLVHWDKRGPVLDFGAAGDDDSASASYGVAIRSGADWHLFYVGARTVANLPGLIPSVPYVTMKAHAKSPTGPWLKQNEVVPFRPKPGTYYADTASPGYVVEHGGEYLQFFSAAAFQGNMLKRTIGIARAKHLDDTWIVDAAPALPADEQIENTSLYFESANLKWFLFTDHVGFLPGAPEFTDAIWVYWSNDLEHWDPKHKAVVLDSSSSTWSKGVIGLPSVVKVGERLAVFYDGLAGNGTEHIGRDIGLAWLDLPLVSPE
jgi:predicted GH43/DUF377 family glycosyl hydrolase